ncbi:cell division cycle-associated protein 3-like [Littorina saxatilis]|uniref:Uncharacterized protein n=1 Tax=Littorina saxatilis TaxID=31220 RepID=A0AAN9G3H1_9CAEN
MGATQHKEAYSPGSEPFQDQHTTPPREQCAPMRQLPFDPRSPTDEISRTPIIVDKTLDSVPDLDPRSPTVGIERTPLPYVISKGSPADHHMVMEVEASPHLFASVQAPLCEPEETVDAEMLTPIKPLPLDIPDFNTDDSSPLLENTQPPQMNMIEPTPMQTRPVPQRKQLFATATKPAYVAVKQPPVTRPLGLVARDTNSPRNIVQSKQRRQVTKSLGGVRGRHNVNDKENMAI